MIPGKQTTNAVLALTAAVIAMGVQAGPVAARQNGTIARASLVAGELVAGTMLALGGAVGFALAGSQTIGPRGGEDPGLVGAAVGAAVGTTIGAAAGVALVDRAARHNPRFNTTLAGSAMGMGLFFLVRPGLRLDPDYPSFWISWFAFPVIGAVLGAHVPRLPRIAGGGGRVRAYVTPTRDQTSRTGPRRGLRFVTGVEIAF